MSRTNLRVRRPRLAMARVLCAGALALAVGAAEVPAVASGEDDPAATEEARIIRDQVAYLAMLDRAEAQLAKGDADAAIEILEKAMALDVPDSTLPRANVPTRNATAHYGLACAFAAKGDLDAARRHLRDAGRNGYRNTAFLQADPRLKEVRSLDGFDRMLENFPALDPTDDYAGKTVADAQFGMGMQMARRNNFPKLGEWAPELELERLHGKGERLSLSSFRGEKPVVLVFGSFT